MSVRMWRIVLLLAAATVFAAAAARLVVRPGLPDFAVVSAPVLSARAPAQSEERAVSHGVTPFAHSVAALEVARGSLSALWYGGTREGSKDSAIYLAHYDGARHEWGRERAIIERERAQRDLQRYLRKLGNPVAIRDGGGRVWLFFVSASVGGWSGSAVNLTTSTDGGQSWSPVRRLVTSPFLNVSTLVKGRPVLYADGTIGLPVYHEFLGKFGELLRIGADGSVLSKTRLSSGRHSLQPVIVPLSESEAVGFMRYAGDPPGRVLAFRSMDRGHRWSAPAKTALPNPNAAVDALRIGTRELLLAFNNQEQNRDTLSLAYSRDGGESLRVTQVLGKAAGVRSSSEYSYPWLVQTGDGDLHLLYTVDKTAIRHLRFNRAWLERGLR